MPVSLALSRIAERLGISVNKVAFFVNPKNEQELYHSFSIPKKSGGSRTISAPRKDLRKIQRKIGNWMAQQYQPPGCVHGFVPGKSIVSNASCHTKKQVIVSIDLEDFFPSITRQRVWGLLVRPPFSLDSETSYYLSCLLCASFGLPQGSPSSPIVSNMICQSLDRKLVSFANSYRAFYTRYADDITISFGNRRTFKNLFLGESGEFRIPQKLRDIIETHNGRSSFKINEEKTHFRYGSTRQSVTGIVVNNKRLNLKRNYYRFLRSCLHHWERDGIEDAAKSFFCVDIPTEYQVSIYEDVVRGSMEYYRMVLGDAALASSSLQKIGSRFNRQCNGKTFPVHELTDSLFLLAMEHENGEDLLEATAFILHGYGLITAKHTFSEAKSDSNGWYKVWIRSFMTGEEREAKIRISENRKNPDYDYIFVSIEDDPYQLFKKTAPLFKARVALIKQKSIYAYELIREENRELSARQVSGVVLKPGGRPNQYGSLATVDCIFFHGMSGGPVFNEQSEVVGIVNSSSSEGARSKYFLIGNVDSALCEEMVWL